MDVAAESVARKAWVCALWVCGTGSAHRLALSCRERLVMVASRVPLLQPAGPEGPVEACPSPTSTIRTLSFDTESLPPADKAPGLPLAHQKPRNLVMPMPAPAKRTVMLPNLPQTTTTTRRSTGADSLPSVRSGRLKCKHYNLSRQKMQFSLIFCY